MKRVICSLVTSAAFTFFTASVAYADCITGGKKDGHSPLQALLRPGVVTHNSGSGGGFSSAPESIVGLWHVTFLVGNGPNVWDEGFEQWHADGTEITIDVAVPPAAGNVCLGVWEKSGPRSVKLHHVGWNWDTSVNPAALAGVFVLDMTVTLGRDGDSYAGHYVSESYDNDGQIIPAFHADGVVRGQRIDVH
jgi:hypothetical protein